MQDSNTNETPLQAEPSDVGDPIPVDDTNASALIGDQIAEPAHELSAHVDGFYTLDPRYMTAERIASLIFSGIIFIGAIVLLVVLWFTMGIDWIWYLVLAAAVLVMGILLYFSLVWPAKVFKRTMWRLNDEGMEIHRGVVWRHQISIPLGRVQHADVTQGPLQRQYEIGKLTIHTAGTQNASVEIDGLTHVIALELRDRLVKQGIANDVV